MGLGNTSRPMKPMTRRNPFQRPSIALSDIGVDRWQYDLWYKIIQAALDGHPDQVDLSYHDALKRPAVSRYGATTPALLKWFEDFQFGARIRRPSEAVQFPECVPCSPAIRIAGCGAMGQAQARTTAEAIGREAGLGVQ